MSFLEDYAIFTSGNESPTIFHNWAGLSVISSLASRKIWVDQGPFIVRPNMYVLLVGNPGVKKSTAMSMARKLIEETKVLPVAPASITKEALTQFMGDEKSPCKKVFEHDNIPIHYTHLSIFANELVSLLEAGGNPTGMITFLTDVWDRDEIKLQTKNKGTDVIEKPFITILGCLTPETMQSLLYQKIISGGFSRRAIFVCADRNNAPVPRPTLTDAQREAWDRCLTRAHQIMRLSGQFRWTDAGIEAHDEWYERNFYECQNAGGDVVFQGYLNSKPEYVLKLAMFTALSENDDMVIDDWNIRAALGYLEQVEPGYRALFSGTGRNELARIGSMIEEFINASPNKAIPTKIIYARFTKDANMKELQDILSHSIKGGRLEAFALSVKGIIHDFIGMPGTKDKVEAQLRLNKGDSQQDPSQ